MPASDLLAIALILGSGLALLWFVGPFIAAAVDDHARRARRRRRRNRR